MTPARDKANASAKFRRDLFAITDLVETARPRRVRWRPVRILAGIACLILLWALIEIPGSATRYTIAIVLGSVPTLAIVLMIASKRLWRS